MKEIEEAIAALRAKLAEIESEARRYYEAIRTLEGLMEFNKETAKQAEVPDSTQAEASPVTANMKGISEIKRTKDGVRRWRAQVWDSVNKKTVNVGHRESIDEAIELRDQYLANMDEQKNNNPDRPVGTSSKGFAWECNTCGRAHYVKDRPENCQHCNHMSFAKVPVSGKRGSKTT
jgi:rubrerythrin